MSRRRRDGAGAMPNGRYFLRLICRHGKPKLLELELGFPMPGNVCEGCLVDHPAIAILNPPQARDLRALTLDETASALPPLDPVTGSAMALELATELCLSVGRKRPIRLGSLISYVLTVCTCRRIRLAKLTYESEIHGILCGCGMRLPSISWLADYQTIGHEDEELTVFGQRRALRAARGLAPIVDLEERRTGDPGAA